MAQQHWPPAARALLGLLALAAAGWADQAQTAKALLWGLVNPKSGNVDVQCDDTDPNKPVVGVCLRDIRSEQDTVKALKEFKSLRSLGISNFTDAGLKALQERSSVIEWQDAVV
jgi:hypothetical protein